MPIRFAVVPLLVLLLLSGMVSGCGQKGPLYLAQEEVQETKK